MSTEIQIFRSLGGISDDDFTLLATPSETAADPSGNTYEAVDSPVVSGQLAVYKARRHDTTSGLFSAFSPLVYARGPWPTAPIYPGVTPVLNTTIPTNTPSGIQSKLGIGIEASPGAAVKAGRLLERVSGNLEAELTRIKRKATHNHPGTTGHVSGVGKVLGQLTLEVTPESLDELMFAYFGAPTTTVVAGPAAPAAPTGVIVGTAGAATGVYTLIACNAQGDSTASATLTLNTLPATLNGTNYAKLSWLPVAGASYYKLLKAGALLATTNLLTASDQGQATTVYAAPAAASGNVQTYVLGLNQGTVSLQERRGGSIYLFAGCRGNKLGFKFEKTQGDPFTITADMEALYEILGYTEAQLGLDVAGFDPLGAFGIAPSCQTLFAGTLADASTFSADIDRNLGEHHGLTGYMAPNSHYLQGSSHSVSSTLYFSTEGELQRYFNQTAPSGPYGPLAGVSYFPISIIVTNPVNAGGVINQYILQFPNATYEKVGQAYKGKEAIMQDVTIYPDIDPVTGTDFILQIVNSRSNAGIITPGTLVTPVPVNGLYPYVA